MRIVALILTIISLRCDAQVDYNTRLSARLEEIKKLDEFNNEVVVSDDTSRYGFPRWVYNQDYYQDDIVSWKGVTYTAIIDSKGKKPVDSPHEWKFLQGTYHPYQFLRDTAKVEDLKKLLNDAHPFIRTYAFGAPSHRKIGELFIVIQDNLSDTSKFIQMTGDYGFYVSPGYLMIMYELNRFSTEQVATLETLIKTKYPHLKDALKLLRKE